jgi:hypothetical protein
VKRKEAGGSAGNVDTGRKLTVLRGQLCCNTEELLSVEGRKEGRLSLREYNMLHTVPII